MNYIFLFILNHCLYSTINNISFEESFLKYIKKFGIIDDLESHASELLFENNNDLKIKINDTINIEAAKKIFELKEKYIIMTLKKKI